MRLDVVQPIVVVALFGLMLVLMASCADPRRFAREGTKDWCPIVGEENCK